MLEELGCYKAVMTVLLIRVDFTNISVAEL